MRGRRRTGSLGARSDADKLARLDANAGGRNFLHAIGPEDLEYEEFPHLGDRADHALVAAVVDVAQLRFADAVVDTVHRLRRNPNAVAKDGLADASCKRRVEIRDRIAALLLRHHEPPLAEQQIFLRRHRRRLHKQSAVTLDVAAQLLLQSALALHERLIVDGVP